VELRKARGNPRQAILAAACLLWRTELVRIARRYRIRGYSQDAKGEIAARLGRALPHALLRAEVRRVICERPVSFWTRRQRGCCGTEIRIEPSEPVPADALRRTYDETSLLLPM